MSISSRRASRAGTTRREELSLFVDRHRYVREFIDALHAQPRRERVLFFYGVGGVGKSLLLRYLQERGCKLTDPGEWQSLSALGDDEFRQAFEGAPGAPVPIVLHDFAASAVGDDPCDPFHGPLMLRSQLGRLGFRFPRFDFAVVLYAHHRGYSPERLAELLPASDGGVTAQLLELLVENSKVASIASFVTTKLFERYGQTAATALAKHRAPDEVVAEIYGLELQTELIPRLPQYLAEDLDDGLVAQLERGGTPAAGRLCLFFDTHDAFWSERHFGGSEAQRNSRDEWFRSLVANLELTRVHVVVTGRERPRWATAARESIPPEFVHLVAVGDLDPEDAARYLEQRGLASPADRDSILSALATENGFHPLSLGLAADLVGRGGDLGDISSASLDFADIGPGLLDRLLSYLPAEECRAITALGACRSFDRALYLVLGRELAFAASAAAFAELTHLSFVLPVQNEATEPAFKIHTVLRRSLMDSKGGDVVHEAHRALERHYRELSEAPADGADLERLFHASRTPGRRDAAVDAWLGLLRRAAEDVDITRLMRVLGLEDEMPLTTWQGRAALALGRTSLTSSQGRDEDSIAALEPAISEGRGVLARGGTEADRLLQAELLLQLGWVLRYRTEGGAAEQAFREAVDLVRDGSAAADHMRGRLYFGWSGVPSDAGEATRSHDLLDKAGRAYEYALRRSDAVPQMRWISDASFTDTCRAGNLLRRGDRDEAEQVARHGVALAEQAHQMAPDDVRGLANLESAYAGLASCLAATDLEQALAHADRSVELCQRGDALRAGWGERPVERLLARAALRSAHGDARGATADEQAALDAAGELVERKPRHRGSHVQLAEALRRRAQRCAAGPQRAEALDRAVASAQRALELAPGWVQAQRLLAALEDERAAP